MGTRIFSAVLLICMLVNAGCAVHNKAYLGQARSLEEVGVVSPAVEKGFRRKSVVILKIDGQDNIDEWHGGNAGYVSVLPGEHTFLVEYKQATTATTIPIVDLVTLVQDAHAARTHAETQIVFPVKAGVLHRIHYDVDRRVFSVSRDGPAIDTPAASTLNPTEGAVPCAKRADSSGDLWCHLGGQ